MKRSKKIFAFGLGLLLFSAQIIFYALYIPFPTPENPLCFYATSTRDDLKQTFLKAIQRATHSIWICSYGITDLEILSALKEKSRSGVRVDLFYNQKNNRKLTRLSKERFVCHPIREKGLMHEKIMIIDSTLLLFGSANLTPSSLKMHDNFVLSLYAPKLAQQIKTERNAHIHYSLSQGQNIDLFFLPEAGETALNALLSTLDQAKKKVFVALFTFTHPLLLEKLIALHKKGIEVEVFLDGYTARGASKKVFNALKEENVKVAVSRGPSLFHHKWALVDEKTFILGSANWTRAAFSRNRDFLLFLSPLTSKQKKSLRKILSLFSKECRQ